MQQASPTGRDLQANGGSDPAAPGMQIGEPNVAGPAITGPMLLRRFSALSSAAPPVTRWLRAWVFAVLVLLTAVTVLTAFTDEMP